jgi:hypothetical protein
MSSNTQIRDYDRRDTVEFTQLPRSGDTVYGFAADLYPTDHPNRLEAEPDTGT